MHLVGFTTEAGTVLICPCGDLKCDTMEIKGSSGVVRALSSASNEDDWSLSHPVQFNTLRTGDADLRFYITTVQDR